MSRRSKSVRACVSCYMLSVCVVASLSIGLSERVNVCKSATARLHQDHISTEVKIHAQQLVSALDCKGCSDCKVTSLQLVVAMLQCRH